MFKYFISYSIYGGFASRVVDLNLEMGSSAAIDEAMEAISNGIEDSEITILFWKELPLRYWECQKCGMIMTTEDDIPPMCTHPADHRTSGICGGGCVYFDERNEMSKEEELKTIEILSWIYDCPEVYNRAKKKLSKEKMSNIAKLLGIKDVP